METMMKMSNVPSVGGFNSFQGARMMLNMWLKDRGHDTHPDTWQGVDVSKRPEMRSRELLNVTFSVPLNGVEDLDHWRQDIRPNLPWADDHFEERVCGWPLNPGKTWEYWPWGKSAANFLDAENGTMFNHSYAERIWPKYAGMTSATKLPSDFSDAEFISPVSGCETDTPHFGVRGQYGDLNDLVDLLVRDPMTRQAYLPLYFPEDTGTPGRKPCTLGYQFIMRDGGFYIYYPLRSCDFVRHWADDCYLAVRLLLWVLDECRKRSKRASGDPRPHWEDVKPAGFTMHCTSLHVFANDLRSL
jgi:hypothetical protein